MGNAGLSLYPEVGDNSIPPLCSFFKYYIELPVKEMGDKDDLESIRKILTGELDPNLHVSFYYPHHGLHCFLFLFFFFWLIFFGGTRV
jgi:hypothetical protein